MEAVYLKKKHHPTNFSNDIILNDYFKKYSEVLSDLKHSKEQPTNFLARNVGVDEDEIRKLDKKVGRVHLKKTTDSNKKFTLPLQGFRADFHEYNTLPEDCSSLKTLRAVKQRSRQDRATLRKTIKYHGEFDLEDIEEQMPEYKTESDLVPSIDYMIVVRIYLPCIHAKFSSTKSKILQVNEELFVPSTITLDRLRDRIACQTDFQPLEGDVSEDPLASTTVYAKDEYKSGMFYIGNVFYVDCRYPSNIDYSEPIRKWGKSKNLDLNYVEPMELTKISDLKFRLGYPYLYMHQGDCEHLITFTDARLLHGQDNLYSKLYPILKSYSNLRGNFCMTCGSRIARFIVADTERLPSDNTYMCTTCLYLYNYVDDVKMDNFKVYKYVDRVSIL